MLEICLLTTFASLDLSPALLKTLADKGYETPTPIQARCIPPALEGRDLLGCAQTGTGKTAAFSLPLIDRLASAPHGAAKGGPRRARALILAPTRELAGQIEDSLRTYGRGTRLRHVVIYGGVKQGNQVRKLRAGVDIIVATPGRLIDLMDQGHVDLSGVETFVLDEADRMLDMGFIAPIRQIGRALPEKRQTLLFSATMPPKIRDLAGSMLHDPVRVSVVPKTSETPLIEQKLYHVAGEHKHALLAHLLRDKRIARTVVFTRTKHGADQLAKKLGRVGVSAGAIHGNKTQGQRQRALDAFRSGDARVLVATDVAARGLDVDGVTHVFNYNLPNEPEAYVHRIGRTGRAGATGQAISFCSRDERGYLRAIEQLTRTRIETSRVPLELGLPEETPPERRDRPAKNRTRRPNGRPAEGQNGRENGRPGRKPRRDAGQAGAGNGSKREQKAGPKTGASGRRGPKAGGNGGPGVETRGASPQGGSSRGGPSKGTAKPSRGPRKNRGARPAEQPHGSASGGGPRGRRPKNGGRSTARSS